MKRIVSAFVIGWPNITQSGTMTLEAAKQKFSPCQYVPIDKVTLEVEDDKTSTVFKNNNLGDYDACFPRISISYKEWGYEIARILSQNNIYLPFAPETILWAHNKFTTLEVLKRHKIKVPKTYLAITTTTAKKIVEKMTFPIIVKLISGAGGKGVMFIESEAAANALFDTLQTLEQPIFIEEYIENKGEDIRAFVIGNEVYGMKRKALKGEKRANLHSGGKGESYLLTKEEEEIALRSARAMKTDICGVDILNDMEGKPFVIEVNISPGLTGISEATGKNMAEKIVSFAYEKVRK